MPNRTVIHKGWFNFILFFILALLWSGSFINIKVVVGEFPPIFCAMVRVLISLLCLSLIFTLHGKSIFSRPTACWQLWLAGLFAQGVPFLFLFFGEKFIAPAFASIINSTVSIWALLLGTLIFRDFSQWTPIKLGGIILGFVGITLVFAPFLHGGESSLLGIVSVFLMAIAYAIGSLINQYVIFKNLRVRFEDNLIQQHFASIVFLFLTSVSFEGWPSWESLWKMKFIFSFFYLGMMATAIAWMIYFYLIREWGAVRASSVMYLVPIFAIGWDRLFLHLVPGPNELVGMIAILSGVTLIQWARGSKPKGVLTTHGRHPQCSEESA